MRNNVKMTLTRPRYLVVFRKNTYLCTIYVNTNTLPTMHPILQRLNEHLNTITEEQVIREIEEIIAESPELYNSPDNDDGQGEPYEYENNNQTSQ